MELVPKFDIHSVRLKVLPFKIYGSSKSTSHIISSNHNTPSLSVTYTTECMINFCHYSGRISRHINENNISGFLHRENSVFSGIDLCLPSLQICFLSHGEKLVEKNHIKHFFSIRNSGFIQIEICNMKKDFDEIVPMKNEKQCLILLVAESV